VLRNQPTTFGSSRPAPHAPPSHLDLHSNRHIHEDIFMTLYLLIHFVVPFLVLSFRNSLYRTMMNALLDSWWRRFVSVGIFSPFVCLLLHYRSLPTYPRYLCRPFKHSQYGAQDFQYKHLLYPFLSPPWPDWTTPAILPLLEAEFFFFLYLSIPKFP